MLVQSSNAPSNPAQVPVEESGSFGSHHHNQNYCYQVCLTPESAKTDLMFLKPCSPSRSTDAEHNPCGAIVTGYADQQPDIISNGSILSSEVRPGRAPGPWRPLGDPRAPAAPLPRAAALPRRLTKPLPGGEDALPASPF